MNLNELFEESVIDQPELRGTRTAPATTLVIGMAFLTQLMVLSGVAIIMGIAVVTMCAFVVELLLLTVVVTILERGLIDIEDLGTIMELAATLLVTVVTIVLASVGGNKSVDPPSIVDGYPVGALKVS